MCLTLANSLRLQDATTPRFVNNRDSTDSPTQLIVDTLMEIQRWYGVDTEMLPEAMMISILLLIYMFYDFRQTETLSH